MFGRNLKFLRSKYGLEQMDLAEKLGRKSSSTISEWEKGKYTPKLSTLNEISKIFNVEIDDLMNIDLSLQTSKVNNDINIIYNKLNSDRQQKVYSFAERQLEEQNNKVVPMCGQTAANPNEISYGDSVVDEQVSTDVPNQADCALVVNGDSMEPKFKNGSIVFYRSQPTVENGTKSSGARDGVLKKAEYKAEYKEDWKGLETLISKVVIVEINDAEKANSMLDNNFVVQVYFTLKNNSDRDFNAYPDQGTLVIEGQQIDSEMFGDNIGGEILKGVSKEGIVTYSVPKINDIENVKDIRLKWTADYDTDNYEEDFHKEYDVTFDLTKE